MRIIAILSVVALTGCAGMVETSMTQQCLDKGHIDGSKEMAGCISSLKQQEVVAAYVAQDNVADCLSYGFAPYSAELANCRMQMQIAKMNAQTAKSAALYQPKRQIVCRDNGTLETICEER